MPEDIRFVDEIAKTSVGKIDKKALRAAQAYGSAAGLAGGRALQLVNPDMRVIIVMQADCRMVDLAEMIELVEGAFKQLPVHQEGAHAVSCLHDLHGQMPVMIEALATDQRAVLRVCPAGEGWHAVHQTALKIESRALPQVRLSG